MAHEFFTKLNMCSTTFLKKGHVYKRKTTLKNIQNNEAKRKNWNDSPQRCEITLRRCFKVTWGETGLRQRSLRVDADFRLTPTTPPAPIPQSFPCKLAINKVTRPRCWRVEAFFRTPTYLHVQISTPYFIPLDFKYLPQSKSGGSCPIRDLLSPYLTPNSHLTPNLCPNPFHIKL